MIGKRSRNTHASLTPSQVARARTAVAATRTAFLTSRERSIDARRAQSAATARMTKTAGVKRLMVLTTCAAYRRVSSKNNPFPDHEKVIAVFDDQKRAGNLPTRVRSRLRLRGALNLDHKNRIACHTDVR